MDGAVVWRRSRAHQLGRRVEWHIVVPIQLITGREVASLARGPRRIPAEYRIGLRPAFGCLLAVALDLSGLKFAWSPAPRRLRRAHSINRNGHAWLIDRRV